MTGPRQPTGVPRASVLYISYDGLMEPLGQSQVFQYLRGLAQSHDVTLMSFEKPADWGRADARERVAAEAARAGIRWHPRVYHARPTAAATLYDILAGTLTGARLVRRHRIGIVHARSYIAGAIALLLRRLFGLRFVFDMRGFWADERMEGGQFTPRSPMYRMLKRLERALFRSADVVVSLTDAGVPAIAALAGPDRVPEVRVIPTCTSQVLFRPSPPRDHPDRRDAPFVLGYVGTVGSRYMFDAVLRFYAALLVRRPHARLQVVNRGQHEYIAQRVAEAGVPPAQVEVSESPYDRVGERIAGMDAGIMFYRPTFSTLGTAPTRLGEFLSCGVPCVANAGVGDVADVIAGHRVGVVVGDADEASFTDAVDALLAVVADPGTPARCVSTAVERFSLQSGIERYDRIYRELAGSRADGAA